jgi:hypothetical protein
MSLILIAATALLVVLTYRRVSGRAQSAIRGWAREYGYRVVSTRFVGAFDDRFQDAGRAADLVYRAELMSSSGETVPASFLIWDVLFGTPTVVVRWDP